MSYRVKECFLTLQGEGMRVGRVAVLCRMSGCNLWSGREADRAKAICQFCDTQFVGTDGAGGGEFQSAEDLATHIEGVWPDRSEQGARSRYVFFTGGEPLLQLDSALVQACQRRGFEVGVETNGTRPCPPSLDWICVSPKAGAPLLQRSGNELKLVYPQSDLQPASFEGLAFEHLLLQPMDGPHLAQNTRACIEYCMRHPRWKLSIQTHKVVGLR